MKLHIRECLITSKSKTMDLTEMLIEILTKDQPIKLDSDYLDDEANETNIYKYANDPTMKELKSDMTDFCIEIAKDIEKINGVESVNVKPSNKVGMSTYVTVNFTQPDKSITINNQYLQGYGGEYKLKFRISNHKVASATDADVLIDVLNKKFDDFKNEVLTIVETQIEKLNSYYRDFKKTKKVSASQKNRNKERKARKDNYTKIQTQKHRNKGYNNDSRRGRRESLYRESFGGSRLNSLLDKNTVDYLKLANVNAETIADQIETNFNMDNNDYVNVLKAAARCIRNYVIEYTFDNLFDYDLLFDDMEDILN